MKNKDIAKIRLQVPSGKANPAPPIGPALGQKGLNIMDFCKQFNALKFNYPEGTLIPVVISANTKNKSFTFITKNPPTALLIKMATIGTANKGSDTPGKKIVGKLTLDALDKVVAQKMVDMNAVTEDACRSMVIGTARSMGLDVSEVAPDK